MTEKVEVTLGVQEAAELLGILSKIPPTPGVKHWRHTLALRLAKARRAERRSRRA